MCVCACACVRVRARVFIYFCGVIKAVPSSVTLLLLNLHSQHTTEEEP